MKNKIKLTDLSHLESLDDEMIYLKGGDEELPTCWGCKCPCDCSNDEIAKTTGNNTMGNTKNSHTVSEIQNIAVGLIIGIILL